MDPFQQKLLEEVSYLRGRFDTEMPNIAKSIDKVSVLIKDHEDRLSDIETNESYKKGQTVILSTVVAVIFTAGVNWLFKKF